MSRAVRGSRIELMCWRAEARTLVSDLEDFRYASQSTYSECLITHGQNVGPGIRIADNHQQDIFVTERLRTSTIGSLLAEYAFEYLRSIVLRLHIQTIAGDKIGTKHLFQRSILRHTLLVIDNLSRPCPGISKGQIHAVQRNTMCLKREDANIVSDIEVTLVYSSLNWRKYSQDVPAEVILNVEQR
ncbi:hypothetical protein B0T18DRAFT_389296 [Schizothecium vesticola]|uniref:Uncharacterized protein n=1 Tax=Schizothecium vesticola TaxID=314040 RepID=A0AA40K8C3_9PEZI|nr:hypothetical protein B0T18DRAFT_389296 [Schizothecium vesticola]